MIIKAHKPTDFFKGFFNSDPLAWDVLNDSANNYQPQYHIKENENGIELELAIPGYSKKDLTVKVEDGNLMIAAEIEATPKMKAEKSFGKSSFSKTFSVDESKFNLERINATHENGVLKVLLPFKEEAKKVQKLISIK